MRLDNADIRGDLQTAFLYGRSTSNQRIECWWSKFTMLGMERWISHFKQLELFGIIDVTKRLDIECVRFCYMDLLQRELNSIRLQWNTHRIRSSRTHESPSGKPDVMYHMPQLYDTQPYLKPMNVATLNTLSELLTRDVNKCSSLHTELFQSILDERLLSLPNNLYEGADLLVLLLDIIDDEDQ